MPPCRANHWRMRAGAAPPFYLVSRAEHALVATIVRTSSHHPLIVLTSNLLRRMSSVLSTIAIGSGELGGLILRWSEEILKEGQAASNRQQENLLDNSSAALNPIVNLVRLNFLRSHYRGNVLHKIHATLFA